MAEETKHVTKEEFSELRKQFEEHMIEHRIRDKAIDEKITKLVDTVTQLAQSTKDIVDAWKVADGLQRFGKWLSGFAGFGVLISILVFIVKHT